MTLKTTHLYMFPLGALVDMGLGGALREASGSPEQVAHLRWDRQRVKGLLRHEPAPDAEGQELLSISLRDMQGKSLMRVTHEIENVAVMALADIGSNHLIADILGIGEWDVRRIKIRAKRDGL